jgi:hypothetical protein
MSNITTVLESKHVNDVKLVHEFILDCKLGEILQGKHQKLQVNPKDIILLARNHLSLLNLDKSTLKDVIW